MLPDKLLRLLNGIRRVQAVSTVLNVASLIFQFVFRRPGH
jgi:hypothetical protein